MEGGEMKDARAGKWLEGLKKYRLAALAALLGILLMLLAGGNAEAEPTAGSPDAEAFDRAAVQEEMENILRAIDGVGELRLMLTVDSGTKRELAQDTTAERSGSEDMKRKSEAVVIGTGSGTQEVVVTNRVYPRYVGALVVCEGGGSAGVRLAVTQAVRRSDRRCRATRSPYYRGNHENHYFWEEEHEKASGNGTWWRERSYCSCAGRSF